MKSRVSYLLVAGLLSFATLPSLKARPCNDRPRKLTIKSWEENTSAVDAKGVNHCGRDYGGPAPWMGDAVKKQRPKYPYEQRARYVGGIGMVRVTLDLSTGTLSKVVMVRSTGVPVLDSSAMEAFRQWQWKPRTWKEIDVPIIFTRPGIVVTPDVLKN